MKQFSVGVLLVAACVLLSGCYKTKIITGKPATNKTAEIPWAHGFIDGLVPPTNAPLETQEECGDAGVAEVDFRVTFPQLIVSSLTDPGIVVGAITGTSTSILSIYTPQQFTARCASPDASSDASTVPDYLRRDRAAGTTTAP